MKISYFAFYLIFIIISSICVILSSKVILAVHGGASEYKREKIDIDREILFKKGIFNALKAGYNQLKSNLNHLEAVKAAIIQFEDNPLFNAGKGGKITQDFTVELDASIMDGSNLKCGAVAGIKTIKNPIKAAELMMNQTPHILLISESAEKFATSKGLETVENSYFFTKERVDEWIKKHEEQKYAEFNDVLKPGETKLKQKTGSSLFLNMLHDITEEQNEVIRRKFKVDLKGTVGAVALDSNGNLAAATSTGGTTYKMSGRVGDSPIIGAGNYANSKTVAVSCTGDGEEMIRRSLAFDVHARMLYKGLALNKAAAEVLEEIPEKAGGFIALDKDGNVEMPFNTGFMARGYVNEDGIAFISLFNEILDYTPVTYDLNKGFS